MRIVEGRRAKVLLPRRCRCESVPRSPLSCRTAGIEKGSGVPNRDKVASLTHAQVIDIAQKKMADLNANDVEMAARIIAGTARSMGVEVEA